jgi:hypothetical protein
MARQVSFYDLNRAGGMIGDSDDEENSYYEDLKVENLQEREKIGGKYTVTREDDPSLVAEKAEEEMKKRQKKKGIRLPPDRQTKAKAKELALEEPDYDAPVDEKKEDAKLKSYVQQAEAKSRGKESKDTYTETGRLKYRPPQDYNIQWWNPAAFPLNAFVIEYGKRRTGKSYFTRDFFFRTKGKWFVATIHTDTKFNGFFQEFVDEDYIYDEYNDYALGKLFEKCKELVKMRNKKEIPEWMHFFAIVWLDDVVADNTLRYSKFMDRAATQGRHYDMCVGINTQKGTRVPPTWRENADIVVIFTQLHAATKVMLAEEYLSCLNLRTALEMIDLYTQDHGCLVLELWRNTNDPEEFIFHYRAEDPGPFQACAKLPEEVTKYLEAEEDQDKGIADGSDDDDW